MDLKKLTDDQLRAKVRETRAAFREADAELTRRLPRAAPVAPRIGGSFAPPLGAEKIAAYRALAASADPAVAEAVLALCDMVALFRETPASRNAGTPHPSGRGTIVPLEDAEIKRIWDTVPWEHEAEMYARLFDGIDPVAAKPLRDAAFHLLWFAVELGRGREPLTADRL